MRSRVIALPDWPVGTWVKMVNCSEARKYAGFMWKTRSEPYVMCGRTPVVLLDGYKPGQSGEDKPLSGCFATDCLEVVPCPPG